jgi:uncharacterized protein (TIGR02466 family)
MEIIKPFVEGIYHTNLKDLKIYNDYFIKKILDDEAKNACSQNTQNHWLCDTFNYRIDDDLIFNETLDTFKYHVGCFAKSFLSKNKKVKFNDGWLNLSNPNSFQEYHVHPHSHFSAVYYVKVPKNSGKIVFKKRGSTNMFDFEVTDFNELNGNTFLMEPKECDFLIFRSDLEHMVEKNKSCEHRVSLAMNFTLYD